MSLLFLKQYSPSRNLRKGLTVLLSFLIGPFPASFLIYFWLHDTLTMGGNFDKNIETREGVLLILSQRQ